MSELSEADILRMPGRLLAMLSSGEEVRIVANDGHVLGFATAPQSSATDTLKPDMQGWAREVEARLKRRFGDRVVADSAAMLNESREDCR